MIETKKMAKIVSLLDKMNTLEKIKLMKNILLVY